MGVETWAAKGATFGLVMWLIATVPGMVASYSSFPLSILTIISWTIGGLANAIVAGFVFAKLDSR